MKLKLISEIRKGFAFHYHGTPKNVYVKLDGDKVLTPSKTVKRLSPSSLVVPHEGKKAE